MKRNIYALEISECDNLSAFTLVGIFFDRSKVIKMAIALYILGNRVRIVVNNSEYIYIRLEEVT